MTKFGTLVDRALLCIFSKIGELWPETFFGETAITMSSKTCSSFEKCYIDGRMA